MLVFLFGISISVAFSVFILYHLSYAYLIRCIFTRSTTKDFAIYEIFYYFRSSFLWWWYVCSCCFFFFLSFYFQCFFVVRIFCQYCSSIYLCAKYGKRSMWNYALRSFSASNLNRPHLLLWKEKRKKSSFLSRIYRII